MDLARGSFRHGRCLFLAALGPLFFTKSNSLCRTLFLCHWRRSSGDWLDDSIKKKSVV